MLCRNILCFKADITYLEQKVDFLDRNKVIFNAANNHSNDANIHTTIRLLENSGYKNIVGAIPQPLTLGLRGGVKIGLLGCTTLMNWGRYKDVCLANDVLALADNDAFMAYLKKKKNLESLTLTVHWGHEYLAEPSPETVAAANLFAESGIDAIVGHGPHVIQRTDALSVQRDQETTVPVAYSVGNFVLRKPNAQNKKGLACTITYDQAGAVIKLDSALFENNGKEIELLPIWQ